jgi:hypothetical protein
MPDFILNGSAYGDTAAMLLQHNFDPGPLRPFFGKDNRPYMTLNANGTKHTVLAYNAPALLRKDEWKMIDDAVMDQVYTTPQRMWTDLRAAGNVIRIPNGMGKTIYEYQRASDVGPATTSMDGIRESDADRPQFDLTGIPLPILHKDFQFSLRQIQVSRNNGPALDTMMARLSARKVMEEAEKYTVGTQTFAYGGYNIYGYTNFPQRMTQTITAPTSANHATTIAEILSMRKKMTDKGFSGPFIVYFSPAWDLFLDEDYSTTKGENTLRERVLAIDGIGSVRTSYWLTGNAVVMVQLTPDVAQPIVGMDVTTLQWPTKGGMMANFKVMAILVPLLRADIAGVTGIVHGS